MSCVGQRDLRTRDKQPGRDFESSKNVWYAKRNCVCSVNHSRATPGRAKYGGTVNPLQLSSELCNLLHCNQDRTCELQGFDQRADIRLNYRYSGGAPLFWTLQVASPVRAAVFQAIHRMGHRGIRAILAWAPSYFQKEGPTAARAVWRIS